MVERALPRRAGNAPTHLPETPPRSPGHRNHDDDGLRGATPQVFPNDPSAVLATWNMPDTLRSLDSLAKLDPAPLQGFRVQIYFGDLQEARAVRAAFNRACPDVASHLHPIDPNYAVTVGNFRDAWSAQRAVQSGALGAWDNVLVIPSEIDLPALK